MLSPDSGKVFIFSGNTKNKTPVKWNPVGETFSSVFLKCGHEEKCHFKVNLECFLSRFFSEYITTSFRIVPGWYLSFFKAQIQVCKSDTLFQAQTWLDIYIANRTPKQIRIETNLYLKFLDFKSTFNWIGSFYHLKVFLLEISKFLPFRNGKKISHLQMGKIF